MKLMLKLVIVGCFISCGKADKVESEIAKIEVDLRVKRFDSAFAKSTPDDLPKLKNEYPYLFPAQFSDSLWISRMTDTLQQELAAEVLKHFPELNREKDEFYALFQHARYYFPDFKPPKLITLTADVDYKNKVIYADSLLLIGLDTYLGESHYFYKGIQQYLKKNFTRSQIVVDAALQIAKARTPYPQDRSFLAQMVFYGKLLYVKDMFLPDKTDAEKIGYTSEELLWAQDNEAAIWRYFVEQNLLFSTDIKLQERFIYPAPFSKFYLELDHESPGRLGQYMGWQIVRAYMKNNAVSLQQLLKTPEVAIFNNSRFKPQKQ